MITFSLENLALGFAHAVYRNTEVEDLHSLCRIMDDVFYEEIYDIVNREIKRALNAKEIIKYLFDKEIMAFADVNEITKVRDPFVADMLFGFQCSVDWDTPHEIVELPHSDLTEYLLCGEFKKHCDGQHIFDDSVMKTINSDIANRSLMILKYVIIV